MVRDKAIVKSLVKVKDYRKRNQKHSTNIKSNLQSINTPNENTTNNGTIFPNINISNSNILSSVKNGQTNQREPSEERVDASVTLSQKRQAQTTKLS